MTKKLASRLEVNDSLPSSREVADALLKFLSLRTRAVRPKDVYGPLAECFGLTIQQLALKRRTTHESLWHNRVQTAREHLARKSLLDRSLPPGQWLLTEKGREWAEFRERPFTSFKDLGL